MAWTCDDGPVQDSCGVCRHGGIDDNPDNVIALISPEDVLMEDDDL